MGEMIVLIRMEVESSFVWAVSADLRIGEKTINVSVMLLYPSISKSWIMHVYILYNIHNYNTI